MNSLNFIITAFFVLVLVNYTFAQFPGQDFDDFQFPPPGFEQGSIEIIKPTQTRFSKNQEVEFEVKVVSDDEIESVYVDFFGFGLERTELTKNSTGNYVGSIFLDYKTNGMGGGIDYVAELKFGGQIREQSSFQIDPAEITFDFELIPPPPYYLKSKIEKVKLNAFYPDESPLTADDLRQVEFYIERERPQVVFEDDPESSSLVANLDFELGVETGYDEGGTIAFDIGISYLEDKYENFGRAEASKNVRLKNENPLLKLRLKDFQDYLEVFGGTDLKIKVIITSSPALRNERVYIGKQIGEIEGEEIECEKLSQVVEKIEFLCIARVPAADEESNIKLPIVAEADSDNGKIASFRLIDVDIRDTVFVQLYYPDQDSRTVLYETNKVRAKFLTVKDTDQQLNLLEVPATVNGEEVIFVWSAKEELFEAEYDLTKLLGQEEQVIEIKLGGGLEADREIFRVELVERGVFEGPDFPIELIFVPMLVLIVIFVAAIYFIALKKKRVETIVELQEEAKRLKVLLKRIEFEYYKRRLNDEEFKKRSLEYQTKLDEVLAKLNVRKESKISSNHHP